MNVELPASSATSQSGLSANRPFPGLRPYYFEDQHYFFGREEQIFALYRLFDHSRFVAVVGSSGSGKSSLVRAGFLPLLERESREPTGRVWKFVQMHPGDTPIGNLASAMVAQFFPNEDVNVVGARRERIKFALRQSSFGMADALREIGGIGDSSIVLVVDQFEELFRYAVKRQGGESEEESWRREEATQFVQVLLAASRDRTLNVYVLLTMRSDFIGDCANFRGLPEAVSASQFLVPSLTRDQREQAIRQPIGKVGATIEPELVERLLNDSSEDELPVLQHCLLRLWEAAAPSSGAKNRHLTVRQYVEIGGIAHALSKHADEVLQSLAGLELVVEQAFRSLAEIDNEGRIVRRARLLRELLAETGVPAGDLRTVVDRFREDDCSFLTPSKSEVPVLADDTRIDVGHEALLRRWEHVSGDPRTGVAVTGWLRAEVADAREYRGLLAWAEANDRIGPDTVEERWKRWGSRPRTAAWADRYGGHIEDVERLFRDSLAALQARREQERRRADAEHEEERRRIEDAADRRRIELEAGAARDREAASLRFARLARTAAVIVSALLLIAIGLGVFALQQWRIADDKARVAKQEAATAQTNLAISISLATALQKQAQELLDKGAIPVAAAQQMLAAADATFAQFNAVEQEPPIMSSWATLLIAFADTYTALQDDKTALQMSKKAQAIATKLVAIDGNNADYQFLLYQADYNCGDAEETSSNEALQDYQSALNIAQAWAKKDPADYVWMQRATFIMNKIGDVQFELHHPDQALQTYQTALKISQQLANEHPNDSSLQRDVATALVRIGDLQMRGDKPDLTDALANYQNALQIIKQLADKTPNEASLQSNLSTAYNRVADIFVRQQAFDQAAPLYDDAFQIRKKLADGDPTNASWSSYLAFEYVYIGDMLMKKPDLSNAAENYRQSLNIRTTLVARDASNFNWLRNLAESYTKLAGALFAQDKLADALSEYKAALSLRMKISAQFPDSVTRQRELIETYIAIGDLLKQQGDAASAAAAYQAASGVIQAFVAKHPGSTALESERLEIAQKTQDMQSTNP